VANEPLTFAIVEFLGNFDSNAIKKRWVKDLGYTDISPPLPGTGKFSVASFNNKGASPATGPIAQWPSFQLALVDVKPDWFFISGHHGRQFDDDWDGIADDFPAHAAAEKETGYFNEWYHSGTWVNKPTGPNKKFEIYMTTAHPSLLSVPLKPNDNPLFAEINTKCKGVVLMGCNSMTYPVCRDQWLKFFPNALFIGNTSRVNGGSEAIIPLLQDKICGDEFFRDPPSGDAEMAKLCYRMNRVLPYNVGVLRLQRAGSYSVYLESERIARTFSYPGQLILSTFPAPK
jgi:hypothetical protein